MSMTTLPVELLDNIVKNLEPQELCALQRTSQLCYTLATPFLYKSIVARPLYWTTRNHKVCVRHLQHTEQLCITNDPLQSSCYRNRAEKDAVNQILGALVSERDGGDEMEGLWHSDGIASVCSASSVGSLLRHVDFRTRLRELRLSHLVFSRSTTKLLIWTPIIATITTLEISWCRGADRLLDSINTQLAAESLGLSKLKRFVLQGVTINSFQIRTFLQHCRALEYVGLSAVICKGELDFECLYHLRSTLQDLVMVVRIPCTESTYVFSSLRSNLPLLKSLALTVRGQPQSLLPHLCSELCWIPALRIFHHYPASNSPAAWTIPIPEGYRIVGDQRRFWSGAGCERWYIVTKGDQSSLSSLTGQSLFGVLPSRSSCWPLAFHD